VKTQHINTNVLSDMVADRWHSIESMHVLACTSKQYRLLDSNSPTTLSLSNKTSVSMCCVFTTNAPYHCCLRPVAAAVAAAAASLLAVVSPKFCMPQQTVLVMQEHAGPVASDDFTITDASGTAQRYVPN
jgi:hypothetical protein